MPDTPPERIGVVFVHGIGKQHESDTVREFGEPIRDWVSRWYEARARVASERPTVGSVEFSYGAALNGTPARYELRIPAIDTHPAQVWMMVEGFWADRVSPPELRDVVAWGWESLFRLLPILIQNALREPGMRRALFYAYLRRVKAPRWRFALANLGIFVDFLSQALLAFGYLLGYLGGLLLALILLPAALVPIPQLRRFLLLELLIPIFVEWLGDFQVYTHDRVEALHVRNGVTRAIAWLGQNGFKDIVVIGHSGGGLVGYDAVTWGPAGEVADVRKLITMGSAVNQAFDQEEARARAHAKRYPDAPPLPRLFAGPTRSGVAWTDIWAGYDPVASGRFRGTGTPSPDDVAATNEMNLLTDHGAYFRNDEEVISRLAQEISAPHGARATSRFAFADEAERIQRRWERVITLVGWRLTAMFLFALVVLARSDDLDRIGRQVWAALAPFPTVQGIADSVSGVFELVSRALGGLAGAFTTGSRPVRAVAQFLSPASLEPLASALLAVALIGALFIAVYWALTVALYEPWRRGDRERAVEPVLPERTARWRLGIVVRTIAVPALLVAFAALLVAA